LEVIDGHWWSLVVIGGHWWSLEVIGGHWKSFVVIGGHWWSLEVIGVVSIIATNDSEANDAKQMTTNDGKGK
jgi:hypothetical protein